MSLGVNKDAVQNEAFFIYNIFEIYYIRGKYYFSSLIMASPVMLLTKKLYTLFLLIILTHISTAADREKLEDMVHKFRRQETELESMGIRDTLATHQYSQNSSMGVIAAEVGKLVLDTRLGQTWGDVFIDSMRGKKGRLNIQSLTDEDLSYTVPALAAIAVKNPKDVWDDLRNERLINLCSRPLQDHLVSVYAIITLFQILNQNGLLFPVIAMDQNDYMETCYQFLCKILFSPTIKPLYKDKEYLPVYLFITTRILPFSKYIPSIPNPEQLHYKDILDFHRSFNPRAVGCLTTDAAAHSSPLDLIELTRLPVLPVERRPYEPGTLDFVLRPSDEKNANPLIDSLNTALEGIKIDGPILTEDWNREGSLMAIYDEDRHNYGFMLPAGFHLYMLDWLRSQRQNEHSTSGFLGIEEINYFKDSAPNRRRQALDKFVLKAQLAFNLLQYNIYAGVVRSGDQTGRDDHHYFTVIVTRDPQTKNWRIYALNSLFSPELPKQSTLNCVVKPLHSHITTYVKDVNLHPISLEDIYENAFQTDNTRCGLWAAMTARAVCEAGSVEGGLSSLRERIRVNAGRRERVEESFSRKLRGNLLEIHIIQQADQSLVHAIEAFNKSDKALTSARIFAKKKTFEAGEEWDETTWEQQPSIAIIKKHVEDASKQREATKISSLQTAIAKFVNGDLEPRASAAAAALP